MEPALSTLLGGEGKGERRACKAGTPSTPEGHNMCLGERPSIQLDTFWFFLLENFNPHLYEPD